MKALSFKIPKTGESSFRVQVDEAPHFYDRLHQHPELQITMIVESTGTLFLGDGITTFQEGDLFVIGPNIPHTFKNEAIFHKDVESKAKSISIFFSEAAFGKDFFNLPELAKVKNLFKDAEKGIRIGGKAKEIIGAKLKSIVNENGFKKMLTLFEILEELSGATEKTFMSTMSFSGQIKDPKSEKINQVFQFIMDNYHQPVSLEQAAAVANLSVSAFCRYFKLRTQKTFGRFINELRISTACKLLIEKEVSASEACYQSGFNNLSNFNRQFKKMTGYTPREYRGKHQQD